MTVLQSTDWLDNRLPTIPEVLELIVVHVIKELVFQIQLPLMFLVTRILLPLTITLFSHFRFRKFRHALARTVFHCRINLALLLRLFQFSLKPLAELLAFPSSRRNLDFSWQRKSVTYREVYLDNELFFHFIIDRHLRIDWRSVTLITYWLDAMPPDRNLRSIIMRLCIESWHRHKYRLPRIEPIPAKLRKQLSWHEAH